MKPVAHCAVRLTRKRREARSFGVMIYDETGYCAAPPRTSRFWIEAAEGQRL
jgi:hypothetical protein